MGQTPLIGMIKQLIQQKLTALHRTFNAVPTPFQMQYQGQRRTRHRETILLLHPSHDHAEVTRLHHHAHTLGLEHLHKRRGNLVGQTFLELEATRKYIDDTGNLGETDYLPLRKITDVGLTYGPLPNRAEVQLR